MVTPIVREGTANENAAKFYLTAPNLFQVCGIANAADL